MIPHFGAMNMINMLWDDDGYSTGMGYMICLVVWKHEWIVGNVLDPN